jgi:hypothetical protein
MEKRLKNIQTFEQHSSELNISVVISSKINEGKLPYVWCIKTKDYERIPFYLSDTKKNPLEVIPEFDQGDYWEIDFQSDKYKTSPNDDSFVLIPKSDVIGVWVEDN